MIKLSVAEIAQYKQDTDRILEYLQSPKPPSDVATAALRLQHLANKLMRVEAKVTA